MNVLIPGLGLLGPLQGSECFLHSSCQCGLILQHLTHYRRWQLQQHTCNTFTGLVDFNFNLREMKEDIFFLNIY